ncbi:chemotaxis-specific protein-glutamate methyltransferase CheB [Piscinibacter sp.]|jgi:two-component system chemotaxis response regulator CheB|uniref:chemotaxis-specific protein-glutamate methyltransferase CheB n=1 Tax=Piscinibacter sp. TaxID=1903157 RepID=UPI002F3E8513
MNPISFPIRVLVVEDSPASRELLTWLLGADPQIEVVGVAADGEAAVAAAQRLLPDVITMDIHLPKLDGFGATRRIMALCPTRIVMVTATSMPAEVAASFRALESGALTVIGTPPGPGHPMFGAARDELLRTVKLMAEVKVVKRWSPPGNALAVRRPPPELDEAPRPGQVRLVAIGASTGGPLVLQEVLSELRPALRAPIVIVQHISHGFAAGMAQWLAQTTGYDVRVAQPSECMQPGIAYVAPDGMQLRVRGSGHIVLTDEPPENGFRPSVACLFRSAAVEYGAHAVGVLLTGMGRDGALELKLLRQAGALTLVQDSATAVINGMPGEAVRLGAAAHVLAPPHIASTLQRWVR